MKQLTTHEMESVQGGFLLFNAMKGALTASKDNGGYDVGHGAGKFINDMVNCVESMSYNLSQTKTSVVKGFFSGLFGR
jgi:bacteriocin-like protein